MKKRFLCIVMAGMMISLSACGNRSNENKSSISESESSISESESTEKVEDTDTTQDTAPTEIASDDETEEVDGLSELDIYTGATKLYSMEITQKDDKGKLRPAFYVKVPYNYKMTVQDYNGEKIIEESRIEAAIEDGSVKDENIFSYVDMWNPVGNFAVELKILDMFESWRLYGEVYDMYKDRDEFFEIEDDQHPAFATFDVITGRLCSVNLAIRTGENVIELKYYLNTEYYYENFDLETIAKQLYSLVSF